MNAENTLAEREGRSLNVELIADAEQVREMTPRRQTETPSSH